MGGERERETATEEGELTCEHKKERDPQCLRRHQQDRSPLDSYGFALCSLLSFFQRFLLLILVLSLYAMDLVLSEIIESIPSLLLSYSRP